MYCIISCYLAIRYQIKFPPWIVAAVLFFMGSAPISQLPPSPFHFFLGAGVPSGLLSRTQIHLDNSVTIVLPLTLFLFSTSDFSLQEKFNFLVPSHRPYSLFKSVPKQNKILKVSHSVSIFWATCHLLCNVTSLSHIVTFCPYCTLSQPVLERNFFTRTKQLSHQPRVKWCFQDKNTGNWSHISTSKAAFCCWLFFKISTRAPERENQSWDFLLWLSSSLNAKSSGVRSCSSLLGTRYPESCQSAELEHKLFNSSCFTWRYDA